ncbi:MAG: allantoinase AllB [Deltaproteobacteria bacterium]|nr:allantoinase AllB [Deltaproteobacteria bacterium]
MLDLLIKNANIVTPEGICKGSVAVKGEKIAALMDDTFSPEARLTIDANGNYLLPGVIDAHVHFRDPGLTEYEDFKTGSTAAAFGGVTTVLDMPSSQPIVSTAEILLEKKRILEQKSLVDFGLRAAVTPDNLDRLEDLVSAGAIAFKVFMGQSVRSPWLHDGYLIEAFNRLGRIKLGVGVHAENHWIIEHLRNKLQASGKNYPLAHLESRPSVCEAEAIQRALLYARLTGIEKLYIHHVSAKEGVEAIRKGKQQGLGVFAETCPQYLILSRQDYDRLGSVIKINPPIRGDEDREALYEGILDGTIDMIATDHSPLSPEEKLRENVWEATAGFCGVETLLPLMLNEAHNRRLSLEHLARVTSENPARAYSLYPKKGCIKVGSDADLVLVDLKKDSEIRAEELHSKTKVTPFNGRKIHGSIVSTIVRGHVVVRHGNVDESPTGRMLSPG